MKKILVSILMAASLNTFAQGATAVVLKDKTVTASLIAGVVKPEALANKSEIQKMFLNENRMVKVLAHADPRFFDCVVDYIEENEIKNGAAWSAALNKTHVLSAEFLLVSANKNILSQVGGRGSSTESDLNKDSESNKVTVTARHQGDLLVQERFYKEMDEGSTCAIAVFEALRILNISQADAEKYTRQIIKQDAAVVSALNKIVPASFPASVGSGDALTKEIPGGKSFDVMENVLK